jgi:hypothetical protein
MLFNRPLEEIEERDLQVLIDNRVAERKRIEYKQILPGGTDDDKKEFLADVSSFANTIGGDLLFGIETQAGIPTNLTGIQLSDVDGEKLRLENILRNGISPRLPRVDIHPVALTSKPGYYVLILQIQKSWLFPHRVIFKDHGHFYARNSGGKYRLDVTELRTAFELGGTATERMRTFRSDRVSCIIMREDMPVSLNGEAAKLVLHMVPLEAFTITQSFDLRPLYTDPVKGQLANPLMYGDINQGEMRFNIDGVVRSVRWGPQIPTAAYTQVFRDGIIETVDISFLGVSGWNATQFNLNINRKSFDGERYERKLVATVKRFCELQQSLGITPPVFIMVSFLGVKGYIITHPTFESHLPGSTEPFDRSNLIIPEVMLEDFEGDLAKRMKPIFDTVWNAAGQIESPNYDAEGKFKFSN